MSDTASTAVDAASWPVRHRRWLIPVAVALVVIVAVIAALSWHFASAVLIPDRSDWPPADVTVEALSDDRIGLSRSEDTLRPGVYGLGWQAGHAIVGDVLDSDEDRVTRRLRDVHGYLAPGMEVGINPEVYVGDPAQALGLPFHAVEITGELGRMPAWKIPGRAETWAIVVHGINADPQTGLRIAPALHRAGLPSLLIAYRNDLGAPPSPDGFHHQGLTEWRDLAAAARYALSHGARRLVLVGYSMGGAIIGQFMQRSPIADRVAGLVLDAPALDWRSILSFNATEMGLPGFAALPVVWAIGARTDVDWDSLDAAQHSEDFRLPILLFHGIEDTLVPISISDEFAEELPRWVTYRRVPEADHTESWNVDPQSYERRLTAFLTRIGAVAAPDRQFGRNR